MQPRPDRAAETWQERLTRYTTRRCYRAENKDCAACRDDVAAKLCFLTPEGGYRGHYCRPPPASVEAWRGLLEVYESESDTRRQIMMTANSGTPDDHARLHQYTLPGGWKVLAGRAEADNDRLSLHIAKPNDWWFHVRGMPGSHVLLLARPGDDPDRATLKRAAAIAAYHSKARTAGLVAVSCTRARYVTKPRGAKPGTVEIRKEVILKVRPEAPEATVSGDSDSA